MVCFHCRKPGHGIADCPAALENQGMGTGICYRCGSAEHEITKCKANVDPALVNFLLQNALFVGKWGTCPDLALIIPKESMLMVVAADFVALSDILRKITLKVSIQIEWLQLVAGQRE